jgi:POT family proton-dependent oligopeptide transporter
MAAAAAQNQADMAMSHEPKTAADTPIFEIDEKKALDTRRSASESVAPVEFEEDLIGEEPTEEELETLPRISGKIPWTAFTIAFVELCERFGYYGCQVLCMLSPPLSLAVSMLTLTFFRYQLHPASSSRGFADG